MHRVTAVALAALLVAAAAACSGDDAPDRAETIEETTTTVAAGDSTTATTVATTSDVDPHSLLLTLQDMPPGYSPDPGATDEDRPICNGESAADRAPYLSQATGGQFTAGSTGPFINSTAAVFADAAGASAWLDAFLALLQECGNTLQLETDDGTAVTLELSPLSFNQVGDRTVALRGTTTGGPLSVTIDQVTAQVGNVLVGVGQSTAGLTSPDAALTEQLLTVMVDRA